MHTAPLPRAIFGLGNPGFAYRKTRHNAGFLFLNFLAKQPQVIIRDKRKKFQSILQEAHLSGRVVHLIKPQTYMNLSGDAYSQILATWQVAPGETLIIYDDLDVPLGRFRIREGGSSGGHRGMADIIGKAGTIDIPRIRIGIGPLEEVEDAAEFVLQPFTSVEKDQLQTVFEEILKALDTIFVSGYEKAMSLYNKVGGL